MSPVAHKNLARGMYAS